VPNAAIPSMKLRRSIFPNPSVTAILDFICQDCWEFFPS
jgi:hypothetical protein